MYEQFVLYSTIIYKYLKKINITFNNESMSMYSSDEEYQEYEINLDEDINNCYGQFVRIDSPV